MWPNPQFSAELFTFTEEVPYENFHFLCSAFICYDFLHDIFHVINLDDECKISSIQNFHIDAYGKQSKIATIMITSPNFYCVYLHWIVKLSIKDICKLEKQLIVKLAIKPVTLS